MKTDRLPESARNRRRRFAVPAATLLLFVLIAAWSLWPIPRFPTRKIPLGHTPTVTVEFFNLWTIWWNSDRAREGFSGYWDAPIFFPYEDSFAFSEPQPLTVAVAPVIWFTGSRVLAYNLYLLLSLVLNGVMATRLLRQMSVCRWLAAAGGAGLILLPIVHGEREVLQLVPVWGILWVWIAFLKTARTPGILSGLELGLAFAAAAFSSIHHALFLTVLMLGAFWITYRRWRQSRFWIAAATGVLTAGLLAGPMLLHMRHVMNRYEFSRPPEKVMRFSAMASDYTKISGRALFAPDIVTDRPGWRFGAGWFRSLAALLGIVFGLCRTRRRQTTLFLLTILIGGFLLSLGPHLRLGGWQPWSTLSAAFPGIAQVRSPFRFSYFVQMSVMLLAAQGIYDLWLLKISRLGRDRLKQCSRLVFIMFGLLLAFEVCPSRMLLAQAPDVSRHQDWIAWLRANKNSGEGVLCLPAAPGNLTIDFEITVEWMYYGTFHEAPLFNGYSGFFPDEYLATRDRVREEFPSRQTLNELRNLNVRYVVIDHSRQSAPSKASLEKISDECVRVFQSDAEISIYRIQDLNGKPSEP